MNDDEKFAWLTARGMEIAHLLSVPAGRELGGEMLAELRERSEEFFPGRAEKHRKQRAENAARMTERYHRLWKELHTRALEPVADATAERAWLDTYAARLPAGACQCRQGFRAYLAAHPPDFADYFGWTVDFHNAVNAKLGGLAMPRAEAATLWRKG